MSRDYLTRLLQHVLPVLLQAAAQHDHAPDPLRVLDRHAQPDRAAPVVGAGVCVLAQELAD